MTDLLSPHRPVARVQFLFCLFVVDDSTSHFSSEDHIGRFFSFTCAKEDTEYPIRQEHFQENTGCIDLDLISHSFLSMVHILFHSSLFGNCFKTSKGL